jgi:hypothetical protein
MLSLVRERSFINGKNTRLCRKPVLFRQVKYMPAKGTKDSPWMRALATAVQLSGREK